MTQCLETLCFTMWLTKVQLNSVLVALGIKRQEHGSRTLHPQTRFQCIAVRPMYQRIFISGSKRVQLAVGIHLYSGIREKTTRQPDKGELLWKPEKKVVTMSCRRTFLQLSQRFRVRPVTRRNVWLFGAYEIIIFLLVKEKNEQLQTVRYNCQIKYLIFYKYFLIC